MTDYIFSGAFKGRYEDWEWAKVIEFLKYQRTQEKADNDWLTQNTKLAFEMLERLELAMGGKREQFMDRIDKLYAKLLQFSFRFDEYAIWSRSQENEDYPRRPIISNRIISKGVKVLLSFPLIISSYLKHVRGDSHVRLLD
jgi:hypothetical protein